MSRFVCRRGLAMTALVVLLAFSLQSPANAVNFWWAEAYDSGSSDWAYDVQQTSDGGFIVSGIAFSEDDVAWDSWVLKLDDRGEVEWEKTYGGIYNDFACSVQQTSDGGFVVGGYTRSYGAGYYDYWVLRLDADGLVEWAKTFGGSDGDEAYSIQQTSDGGFVVAGHTGSYGAGEKDYWVLKLDSAGVVEWEKTYGGSSYDEATSIQQTSDGGFVVAGHTQSFGAGGWDSWLLKLDADGNVIWEKTYGSSSEDRAYDVRQVSDGGFIVAGYAGDIGAGMRDYWVLRLDADGLVEWEKTYGGANDDFAQSVRQASDGGFVVAGYTYSYGAGSYDYWLLKLDADGLVEWEKTYGGSAEDRAHSVRQTSDGGFVVAGYTLSYGTAWEDFLVLKLDANGDVQGCAPIANTSSTAADSSATVQQGHTVSTADTSASVGTPSLSGTDTTADTTEVCWFSDNDHPQLSGGGVDPGSGDTSTAFTYSVFYYDEDGDGPSTGCVYIDGSPYSMSLDSGSAANGTYAFNTSSLAEGDHNYYFYFEDGNRGSATLPSWGTYAGPFISPVSEGVTPGGPFDFDGDGQSDILWMHASSGIIYIWLMDGIDISNFGYVYTMGDADWQMEGVGDFNGDSKADILWRHATSGQIYIWIMDGIEVGEFGYVYTMADADWQVMGVGDFDGDGKSDILWRHATSGQVYIWHMDGVDIENFGYVYTMSDADWQVMGVGDFDGDGQSDILWMHASSGIIYIWLMDGVDISNFGYVYTMDDADWQVEGFGDFDGDGKSDILWKHTTSGIVYIWLMDGLEISNFGYVYTMEDPDWQVMNVGDFDGGGWADILWQHSTSGQIYIWLMNGIDISNFGYVYTMEDPDWQIY